MIKISILIPTITGREAQFNSLVDSLYKQIVVGEVEIHTVKDNREMSIGAKRNQLLAVANSEYLCFVDDDDSVSDNYIELLLQAANSGCDCASLKGEITINGGKPEIFEHSLKYSEWKTNLKGHAIRHERFPNHLNLIKASIAKQFKFPEKNYAEDHEWSKLINESGLIKTEHYIPEVIYFYKYISNKYHVFAKPGREIYP